MTDQAKMNVVYSTSEVHPRDRIAYWREVATKGFVEHNFQSLTGSDFRGTVNVGDVADITVSSFDCAACDVERFPHNVSSHPMEDDLLICMLVQGRTIIAQDGRHARMMPGSLSLLDPIRPFTCANQIDTKSIVVKVPRQILHARLGQVENITAHHLHVRDPKVGLAFGFITSLTQRIGELSTEDSTKIAQSTVDLITLALSDEMHRRDAKISYPRRVALLRLKSEIEARLCDADLTPAKAAAAAGISVRYANALLASEDSSLERHILERRLDRCRRALEDPAQSHRSISEVAFAWGFSDLSHFGRRFKARYSLTPTEFRKKEAAAGTPWELAPAPRSLWPA